MNTLGGCMFVYNGDKFDYCYRECIEGLKAMCDQVSIVAIESEDGTHVTCQQYADYKTKVTVFSEKEWNEQQGREKLAYFQNKAKELLDTDYYVISQADEVMHQDSFPFIREAISYGLPSYMVTRHNLWFNAYRRLNVEQHRKPCSTEVVRIALKKYNSINDGESIGCDQICFDFLDKIEIFHMGFVRKMDVMKEKVIHIQEHVFRTPHDSRLDEDTLFNPDRYFDYADDSEPISGELPIFVQQWAKERWGERK